MGNTKSRLFAKRYGVKGAQIRKSTKPLTGLVFGRKLVGLDYEPVRLDDCLDVVFTTTKGEIRVKLIGDYIEVQSPHGRLAIHPEVSNTLAIEVLT